MSFRMLNRRYNRATQGIAEIAGRKIPVIFQNAQYEAKLRRKQFFDTFVALIAVVFLTPLFLLLIGCLLIVQGRPIFIRHQRIGRHFTSFPCFKFRTMAVNGDEILRRHLNNVKSAREEWIATRKLKNDPRITPVGKVLRQTSLDELPQLFNVMRGDMSLVGPRPIVKEEIDKYGPFFTEYVKVRPGLTGAWQISGRNDVSYQARVQLDVHYVRTWTLFGDLVILARTLPAVLRARGCY